MCLSPHPNQKQPCCQGCQKSLFHGSLLPLFIIRSRPPAPLPTVFSTLTFLSKIHANSSKQTANWKQPSSFLKTIFFSACSTVRAPSRSPATTTTPPALPRHRPGFSFPFSRKPETRPGRDGRTLRIFPLLSEGWGEGAAPGRCAASAAHPQKNHSTDRDHRKKERNSGFFSGFPEEIRGAPEPTAPVCPYPTCRPGTDAGHRRPTLVDLEPHGELRAGIARPLPGPVRCAARTLLF